MWIPRRALVAGLAVLALAISAPTFAGYVSKVDLSTPEARVKAAKKLGYKATAIRFDASARPKRVAIGGLTATFTFKTGWERSGTDTLVQQTRKLPDESYQAITDALYEETERQLVEAGFEVVPKDQFLGTKAYTGIVGKDEHALDSGRRTVFAVSGGKFPTTKEIAAVYAAGREVEADAIFNVGAGYSLCGTKAMMLCSSGVMLSVDMVPAGTSYRSNVTVYGNGVGDPLVWDESIDTVTRTGRLSKELTLDAGAFVDGAMGLFTVSMDLALITWRQKMKME